MGQQRKGRKKEIEEKESKGKKSDYERRKGMRTNTTNKLKEENGTKGQRKRNSNKK